MAARAMGTGTISFGLVNIPVKVFSANNTTEKISFNQLHADKKTRLKQQMYGRRRLLGQRECLKTTKCQKRIHTHPCDVADNA